MDNPADLLRNTIWVLTVLLQIALLFFLLRHKAYRQSPAFLGYLLADLFESLVVFFTYRIWGVRSLPAWTIAWSAQTVVIGARWFAVAEVARKIFAGYEGIRAMANRIVFTLGICSLLYALASSRKAWRDLLLYADRSVELCIAVFIVGLFVFARYYRLPVSALQSQLAVGFCIYSCTAFLNDAIFEHWPNIFGGLWNYLPALSYVASLLLWIQAVRKPAEVPKPAVATQISPQMYAQLSEQLNSRLDTLNNRLGHMLRSGDSRS